MTEEKMGRPQFSFVRDILAGIMMAGTSVPQLVAYAETVGYAGYRGLATAGPSLMAWAFSTGSPWMNCGVTSMTALMTKADLDGDSYTVEHGEVEYVYLVSAYSLCVGISSIFLACLSFGKLAEHVPVPVGHGFKWGASLAVILAAIPNGLLLAGSHTLNNMIKIDVSFSSYIVNLKAHFPLGAGAITIAKVAYALCHPMQWDPRPSSLFVLSIIFLTSKSKFMPKRTPPGIEVILVTVLATLFSVYTDYEGSVVGEIPVVESGISFFEDSLHLPVELLDVKRLIFEVPIVDQFNGSWIALAVSSCTFSAISFLSLLGIVSGFESENGIPFSPTRELIAQGVACLVAGFTGSAPVSGSLSRSLVSRLTGATSQLACLVTSVCWIFCLPYMNIMSSTPKAVLSGIIMSAVVKGVIMPKDLTKLESWDAVQGWGTAIATALTTPTFGFMSGILLSITLSFARKRASSKDKLS